MSFFAFKFTIFHISDDIRHSIVVIIYAYAHLDMYN